MCLCKRVCTNPCPGGRSELTQAVIVSLELAFVRYFKRAYNSDFELVRVKYPRTRMFP